MLTLPLDAMKPGDAGHVVDVIGEPQLVACLAERGLKIGSKLQAIAVGNPVLVRVDQMRLSLRSDANLVILVELESVAGNVNAHPRKVHADA